MKEVMTLTEGNYRVDWIDMGESIHGEYDKSNPDDVALLRFDCSTFVDGEWEPMTDASYCTAMPADTDNFTLFLALQRIMATIYGKDNVKKECEDLSWISPDWFDAF